MASGLLHYFNFGASSIKEATANSEKEKPVRALPASWYTSPAMYEMERRAIFSRRWLFMTHSSRVKNTGDWLRYNVAGYDFIITKDRQGNINAFHNVCRHRAHPVVDKEEESGNAKILACRYHGWSYGLNGKLAKAPGYQDLDFDKDQNSLFAIHTKVDRNGFIWVNMDAQDPPEVPFEEHFEDVDIQQRYVDSSINFNDYELDHTYEIDGPFNWKILADNFNECYHCPTTHPDVPSFLNLETFDSDLKDGHIQHYCKPTEEQVKAGVVTHSTYLFPNASMSVSRHFIMIQHFLPTSPTSSLMSYQIYRNTSPASSSADFHLIADMYERVMREDKVLCAAAQKNLNMGVFVAGELHPKFEKAPLFFQGTVREVLREWAKREKVEGKEIWSANRQGEGEDEEICKGIECAGGGNGKGKEGLSW